MSCPDRVAARVLRRLAASLSRRSGVEAVMTMPDANPRAQQGLNVCSKARGGTAHCSRRPAVSCHRLGDLRRRHPGAAGRRCIEFEPERRPRWWTARAGSPSCSTTRNAKLTWSTTTRPTTCCRLRRLRRRRKKSHAESAERRSSHVGLTSATAVAYGTRCPQVGCRHLSPKACQKPAVRSPRLTAHPPFRARAHIARREW